MHTAEPKLGCCNKNIWLLTFTTQSNSGSQCCLVTMAHYWPYLRGHKNVWRSPPLTPSTSSPPAFTQSFLQPHNNLRALIAPLLRVASSQGPSILYTPPNPAGQLCGGYSLPRSSCLFLYRKGGEEHENTWAFTKTQCSCFCAHYMHAEHNRYNAGGREVGGWKDADCMLWNW